MIIEINKKKYTCKVGSRALLGVAKDLGDGGSLIENWNDQRVTRILRVQ